MHLGISKVKHTLLHLTYFAKKKKVYSAGSASLHSGDSNSLSETVVWSINYVIQKVASFKVEPEKNKNKVEPGAEMYSLAGPDYDASSFTSSVR